MNWGSCFFAEIRRTMSSFKPGGAASASTSVTKPYLYSAWTNPSIVSVAVLISNQYIAIFLLCLVQIIQSTDPFDAFHSRNSVNFVAARRPRRPDTAHEWRYRNALPGNPSAARSQSQRADQCQTHSHTDRNKNGSARAYSGKTGRPPAPASPAAPDRTGPAHPGSYRRLPSRFPACPASPG